MPILLQYILTVLMGYLLGCSSMALYVSRARGLDLRSAGSANLGTCNTLMVMGFKYAVLVCLHDMGKAAIAVLLARWFFPDSALAPYIAGVAAVLGHIYPFYLGFSGGKGYASYLGMVLALDWRFGLALLAAVAVIVLASDYIVTGTVMSVLAFPVYLAIITLDWKAVAIVGIASAVILIKHKKNYIRIWNKTEPHVLGTLSSKKRVTEPLDKAG